MSGRARQRHREFERFVDAETPGLLRTAYLITWDLASAEDAVQEGLWRTSRHWDRIASMEFPRAYVRTIVVREAVRQHRAAASRAICFDDADLVIEPRWEASLARFEDRSHLTELLATLTPTQRAVLVLRYVEDLSEREIAEQLECAVGTVKSTASRALDHLRGEVRRDETLSPLPSNVSPPKGHPS